jgi:hypothetical protein
VRDMSSVKCRLAKLVGGVYIMRCAAGKLVVARKRRRMARLLFVLWLTYAWTVFRRFIKIQESYEQEN